MPDPVTTAIATAVAGSAAQSLTEQAVRLLSQITAKIQHKLGKDPRSLAISPASGSANAATLAAFLHQAFENDPTFGSELISLWQGYLNAAAGPATNNFHGTADKVVQLRDVHGDLTIN